ncbi:hypothetical protein GCM10023314_13610 [Algibacter agarivorans]|uniref:Uncharacterized protein n=1 Tax=Algibacter agarivorans TaxID=1109741 RepID=A0ABP9GFS7_9FLAO
MLFNLEELKGLEGYFQSSGQLGILFDIRTHIFRYHSLSSEPSYAAIIVFVCFAVLNDLVKIKKSLIWYGIIVLYMLLSFKSSMGFLILGVWFISQITFSKKYFIILGVIIFTGILLFFFTSIGGKSIDRLREIVFLLFSFKGSFMENLNLIDSSAHARIGPMIYYLQNMDFLYYKTYFGYGAGMSTPYFSTYIYPEAWNTDMIINTGFIPAFLYDFGIIGVSLVFRFIWLLVKFRNAFFKIIFIIILLNSNFNTQLFWFTITIIALSSYYLNKGDSGLALEKID